jgi:redox-sensing transcriptional repressor
MTDNKKIRYTPEPTLRRLARYIPILQGLQARGIEVVSSTTIANEIVLDPTQVRKDIEYTGVTGKPKTGFNIAELISAIETYLNWNNVTDAFLIGAGNLGSALLGYTRFKKHGLNIVAAFDIDPLKEGTQIQGIPVLPLEKMASLAERMKIHIGILTVPAENAQAIADLMIGGGILAIWNFAPVHLKVPENIIVENIQLVQSLAVLTTKLRESFTHENAQSGVIEHVRDNQLSADIKL